MPHTGQMSKMRPESSDPLENIGNLRNLLNQRDREIAALRQDLEKVKKERTTSNALVTTLQRDMSSKEALNKRLKGETSLLRNQLRDREVSLSAMTAKVSGTPFSFRQFSGCFAMLSDAIPVVF